MGAVPLFNFFNYPKKNRKWEKIKTYKINIIHPYFILQVCVALRYFATGANYLLIADCHGVSKSSVTRAVKAISEYFREHMLEYVQWPRTEMEKHCMSLPFFNKTKKPRCFGLVDGTHIAIHCPKGIHQDENQYYCYKGYYSINAMVCIFLFFIYIYTWNIFYYFFYHLLIASFHS